MGAADADDSLLVPLAAEVAVVSKEEVATSKVRVSTHVEERTELIRAALQHQDVTIERVEIGDVVQVTPEVRMDGDVLVVPIVEEILVVEKRLVLKEELRIHRITTVETVEREVVLRSERADVQRTPIERA